VIVAARVDDLVFRYGLPSGAGEQLLALLALIASDPLVPSTVRVLERAVDVHLADSLSALELAATRAATRIADLGSGAGFPGLALAVALPEARVSLLESSQRKCAFLERALIAAGVSNSRVVCERAESWADGLVSCDLVTARAVGPLALLCEYAAPLLVRGGTLVAWKGAVGQAELAAGETAAAELGLEPVSVVRTEPYPGSAGHHLHTFVKTTDTPSRFPRRPGAARKHPLGRPR
jgi:16S rRNA (guanine527-N7)-methyltransferase